MRILYIARLFSGLEQSVIKGKWEPSGAPTIYRLIERLDDSSSIDLKLVLTSKGGFTQWNSKKVVNRKLAGLLTPVSVLPFFDKISFCHKKISKFLSELYQLLYIISAKIIFNPDLIYVDHANIVSASVLSRIFSNTPVIFRLMGVYQAARDVMEINRPIFYVLRWMYRSPFSAIICTQDGSGLEPWLNKAINKKTSKYLLINGVDEIDHSETYNDISLIDKDKSVILFVGKLEEAKGILQYIRACSIVAKTGNNKFYFLIIGNGSLLNKCREIIKVDNLTNMSIITHVNHCEILSIHLRSEIYVSLNRWGNLSNVNLEAMRAGSCIIFPSSKKSIGVDVITDKLISNKAVSRIPSTDSVQDLADSIIFLHNNPNKRKAMSRQVIKESNSFLVTWEERINNELVIIQKHSGLI